jgi:hypothetical protein
MVPGRADLLEVRDVARKARVALARQRGGGGGGAVRVAADHGHPRAPVGQRFRDGPPDPA